jgi:hypothetical protein
MRRFIWLGAAVVIFPILSCSTMTVRADHDSQFDFGAYTTFALFERQGKERRRPQMSEIVDRRIAAAMGAELTGKGLTSTSPRDADFLVTFYTAVRRRVVVNHAGWYGHRWHHWGGGTRWVRSYEEGTQVIDIIDRRRRELVWRGVGEGAFTKSNPSNDKVAKRIARVLQTFPPAG